ncbi:hypothetical protein Y032_0748g2030 [Ancylostoma ceylanicum]|uniref:Uncharacterized protein n=1 Tax=Ancylostoma ceylanicum TaxID=53326 RepID=A0A016WGE1_9BILA|nr:hypothetical protein Y032_0748g2030 [Ancylostoma ceylanicum]
MYSCTYHGSSELQCLHTDDIDNVRICVAVNTHAVNHLRRKSLSSVKRRFGSVTLDSNSMPRFEEQEA